jgi:glycosyltransferase involved in cell wall biosynthesis
MPEISIVIPAYNAEKYLAETLTGVLAQTFSDWELLLIDDGSTDATAEIAARYARRDSRIRLVRQENRGLPGARNRGIAASDPASAYLIFLDADDLWEPDALEALHAAHRADPDAGMVYGFARYIDAQGCPVNPSELESTFTQRYQLQQDTLIVIPWEAPTTFETLLFNNTIRTPGLALIPRSTLQAAGLFDPEGAGVADWDMWLRIALYGRITLLPRIVLAYRLHAGNMSRGRAEMQRGEQWLRKKMLACPQLTPRQRRQVFEAYRFANLRSEHLLQARAMLLAALRGEPAKATRSLPAEGGEWEFPLLAALEGDTALVKKITPAAEQPQTPPAFTPDERRALDRAVRYVCREDCSLHQRWLVRFLKEGRFVPAAKHAYHGVLSLCRWGAASLPRR